MIYFSQTRIVNSVERPVAQGHIIDAEGAALVYDNTGGVIAFRQASGAADEVFAGVSFNMVTTLTNKPTIETFVVGSTGKVTLAETPLPGSVRVVDEANKAIVEAAAASATAYAIDAANPATFVFDTATFEGKTVTVAYTFAPTVAQAMYYQGNVIPGGPAGQYLGQISVITNGDVATDRFDTASDWSTAVGVKLGASGIFVAVANVADAIKGIQILALPSGDSGYLRLQVNAPV